MPINFKKISDTSYFIKNNSELSPSDWYKLVNNEKALRHLESAVDDPKYQAHLRCKIAIRLAVYYDVAKNPVKQCKYATRFSSPPHMADKEENALWAGQFYLEKAIASIDENVQVAKLELIRRLHSFIREGRNAWALYTAICLAELGIKTQDKALLFRLKNTTKDLFDSKNSLYELRLKSLLAKSDALAAPSAVNDEACSSQSHHDELCQKLDKLLKQEYECQFNDFEKDIHKAKEFSSLAEFERYVKKCKTKHKLVVEREEDGCKVYSSQDQNIELIAKATL